MTSPEADLPFDEGVIRVRLLGTWSYPKPEEPSEIDYLHFHESGIAFQLIHAPQLSEKPFPVRMRYSVESSSHIRVRNMKGDQASWTNEYQLEDNTLTLTNPKRTYVCTRVAPEDIPVWFRGAMGKYL